MSRIVGFRGFQTPLDKLDIALWRADAAFRFFLEGMQNVERGFEAHRVDGPVCVTFEIFNQLDGITAEAHQPFCRWWMLAGLRQEEFEAEPILHRRRKGPVVLAARADLAQLAGGAGKLFHSTQSMSTYSQFINRNFCRPLASQYKSFRKSALLTL